MTKENVCLSYWSSNFSIPIPSTFKVTADIPPTSSQHTSSFPPLTPTPLLSPFSLPLPPGCSHESLLLQCPSPDPTSPDEPPYTTSSPDPLPQCPGMPPLTWSTPYSNFITRWLLDNGSTLEYLRFSFSQICSPSPNIFLKPNHYLSPRDFPISSFLSRSPAPNTGAMIEQTGILLPLSLHSLFLHHPSLQPQVCFHIFQSLANCCLYNYAPNFPCTSKWVPRWNTKCTKALRSSLQAKHPQPIISPNQL